eukprot:3665814-Prymnesium_polylepis.2
MIASGGEMSGSGRARMPCEPVKPVSSTCSRSSSHAESHCESTDSSSLAASGSQERACDQRSVPPGGKHERSANCVNFAKETPSLPPHVRKSPSVPHSWTGTTTHTARSAADSATAC